MVGPDEGGGVARGCGVAGAAGRRSLRAAEGASLRAMGVIA